MTPGPLAINLGPPPVCCLQCLTLILQLRQPSRYTLPVLSTAGPPPVPPPDITFQPPIFLTLQRAPLQSRISGALKALLLQHRTLSRHSPLALSPGFPTGPLSSLGYNPSPLLTFHLSPSPVSGLQPSGPLTSPPWASLKNSPPSAPLPQSSPVSRPFNLWFSTWAPLPGSPSSQGPASSESVEGAASPAAWSAHCMATKSRRHCATLRARAQAAQCFAGGDAHQGARVQVAGRESGAHPHVRRGAVALKVIDEGGWAWARSSARASA